MTPRRSSSVRNWTAIVFLVGCGFAASTHGSAIPMWEFLARDEKMSHLYKIFAKQAARYCADSSSPDCSKNLLVAGVRNLANMDENDLDRMDPYQRNADELIWRAIMRDTRLPAKFQQERTYFMPEEDPLATSESESNGLGEESARSSDYARPSDQPHHGGPYLVGPMVIRVFPDGSPVPEDATRPLPRDEDVEDASYARIPSISEIEANGHGSRYNAAPSIRESTRLVLAADNENEAPIDPRIYAALKKSSIRRLVVPTMISVKDSSRYRRLNSLQQDRRLNDVSNGPRILRFY